MDKQMYTYWELQRYFGVFSIVRDSPVLNALFTEVILRYFIYMLKTKYLK